MKCNKAFDSKYLTHASFMYRVVMYQQAVDDSQTMPDNTLPATNIMNTES